MMARTHELTSSLAWLGAGALVIHPDTGQLAAGLVVAAGAGIAPDLDHVNATPAHCFPPFSELVAKGVSCCGGGHRQRTHTLLAALLAAGTVLLVSRLSHLAGLIIAGLCALWTVRVLGPRWLRYGIVSSVAAAAAIGWLVGRYVHAGPWLWEAVLVGYLAHLAGDSLSIEGVPWLWPWRYRFRAPLVPVNSVREHAVAAVSGLAVLYLAYMELGPAIAAHVHAT